MHVYTINRCLGCFHVLMLKKLFWEPRCAGGCLKSRHWEGRVGKSLSSSEQVFQISQGHIMRLCLQKPKKRKYILWMCAWCLCRQGTCPTVFVWGSQDNFRVSFHFSWVPGLKLRLPGFLKSAFTLEFALQPMSCLFLTNVAKNKEL